MTSRWPKQTTAHLWERRFPEPAGVFVMVSSEVLLPPWKLHLGGNIITPRFWRAHNRPDNPRGWYFSQALSLHKVLWSRERKVLGHSASCGVQQLRFCFAQHNKNTTDRPAGLKLCPHTCCMYFYCGHGAVCDLGADSRNNFDLEFLSESWNKPFIFLISLQRVILLHLPTSATFSLRRRQTVTCRWQYCTMIITLFFTTTLCGYFTTRWEYFPTFLPNKTPTDLFVASPEVSDASPALLQNAVWCNAREKRVLFVQTHSTGSKGRLIWTFVQAHFFRHITPKMLIFRNVSNHRKKISLQLSSLPPPPVLRQQADIMNAAAALRGPSGTQMAETDDFTCTFTGRTAGTFDKIVFHQVHSAHRRIPSHPGCSKALHCLGLKHNAKLCVHTHVQEVEIR